MSKSRNHRGPHRRTPFRSRRAYEHCGGRPSHRLARSPLCIRRLSHRCAVCRRASAHAPRPRLLSLGSKAVRSDRSVGRSRRSEWLCHRSHSSWRHTLSAIFLVHRRCSSYRSLVMPASLSSQVRGSALTARSTRTICRRACARRQMAGHRGRWASLTE